MATPMSGYVDAGSQKKAIRKSVSLFFYGKSLAIWRPAVLSRFAHQTMYVHVQWVCCSKHDALHLIQISRLIVCFVKKKTIVNIIPSIRHTLPVRVPRPREFRKEKIYFHEETRRVSGQFDELFVAKANEADAFGNAEVGLCRCRFPKQKPHSKMCGFSFGQHS